MTAREAAPLLRRLEARFGMVGKFWSDAVADTYLDLLMQWPADWGEKVVSRVLKDRPTGVPTDAELESLLRERRAGSDADTYKPPAAEPSGKSPRELMREGFLSEWEKSHPGQPIPAEVERWFDGMEGKRTEDRKRENELKRLAEAQLTEHALRNGHANHTAKAQDPVTVPPTNESGQADTQAEP